MVKIEEKPPPLGVAVGWYTREVLRIPQRKVFDLETGKALRD